MIIDIVTPIQYSGYFNSHIQRIPKDELAETERVVKSLDEERKKVQPVYNAKGQLIEYDEHGRHLNTKA